MNRLARAGFCLLLCVIVYLSWKPSPSIAEIPWMPTLLGQWFDHHDFSKNLIGYGIFGLSGFIAWSRPANVHRRAQVRLARRSILLLVCFCALVLILELGQLALPHRTCDWRDMAAGWLGILLAWSIFQMLQFFLPGRPVHLQS